MATYKDKRAALLRDTFKLHEEEEKQSEKSNNQDKSKKSTIREKFMALEKVCKKEASRWWESETLQRYLKDKRIPRGLRLMTFPTDDDVDEELLVGWQENFAVASENMIRMRIAFVKRCMEKHEEEIEERRREIDSLDAGEVIKKNYEELEKYMTFFQENLCKKKQTKYKRDEIDYKLGRIYTYAKKYDHLYEEDQKEARERGEDEDTNRKEYESLVSTALIPINGRITDNSLKKNGRQEEKGSDMSETDTEVWQDEGPDSSEVESVELNREPRKSRSGRMNFAMEISRIRRSERFLDKRQNMGKIKQKETQEEGKLGEASGGEKREKKENLRKLPPKPQRGARK